MKTNASTIIENPPQIRRKTINIHPTTIKSDKKRVILQNRFQERGPEKTRKYMKKVTVRRAARWLDFGPTVVQNGIEKSWTNWYRTSISKWWFLLNSQNLLRRPGFKFWDVRGLAYSERSSGLLVGTRAGLNVKSIRIPTNVSPNHPRRKQVPQSLTISVA